MIGSAMKLVLLSVVLGAAVAHAGVLVENASVQPLAPRISLSFIPEEMATITFETVNSTNSDYAPVAKLGKASGIYDVIVKCRTLEKLTCYTVQVHLQHICELENLLPNTRYFYQVGSEKEGFSREVSFRSPPMFGMLAKDTSFIVYGDMGLINGEATRKELSRWASNPKPDTDFDFVIHNGDISYADNHVKERNGTGYADMMQEFYHDISDYASHKYYMVSPGNHEWPCDYKHYSQLAESMPYRLAQRDVGTSDPHYYSYFYGNIHVISLSGEQDRFKDKDSEELKWLESDLKLASEMREEGEVVWIFSHIHYPTNPTGYCTYDIAYCKAKPGPLSDLVEDLFAKYGVDIHFTAHEHVYERTVPVYRGEPVMGPKDTKTYFNNPKHPVYVVVGLPGNEEVFDAKWITPAPKRSVEESRIIDFGFVKVDVKKRDVADKTERITVSYVKSKDGEIDVMDSFTLEKEIQYAKADKNYLRTNIV